MNGRQPPHPTVVERVSPLNGLPIQYSLVEGVKRTDFCGRCSLNLYACDCHPDKRPWLKARERSLRPVRRRHKGVSLATNDREIWWRIVVVYLSLSVAAVYKQLALSVVLLVWWWLWYGVIVPVYREKQRETPAGGWYIPPEFL